MALDACRPEIESALGRALTKREEGIIARKAADLKRKVDLANNDPTAVSGILQQFSDDAAAQAANAKRQAALNYRAFAAQKAWHETVEPSLKNPGEALTASVRGSPRNFLGAQDSAANRAQHESNARASAYAADLVKAKVDQFAFNRANNMAVGQSLYELRNGGDEASAAKKYGAGAARVAQVIEDHRERLRLALNAQGAWIGKNSDAIFRRSHDAVRIARAGGNDYGSPEARAAWTQDVDRRMAWDKAFDGEYADATNAQRQKLLDSLHTQFAAGTHLQDGSGGGYGIGGKNVAAKTSHQRQLVFKTGRDEVEYLNDFGRGNSIGEMVEHEMRSGGKDIGVMSKFGVNPEATFDNVYNDRKAALVAANDTAGLAQLDKAYRKLKDNDWKLLTGIAGHPADNFVGRFITAGRTWTSAAAISNSIWSLTGDTVLKASILAQRSGDSMSAGMLSGYLKQFEGTGLSREKQMEMAANAGIRFEGVTAPIDPYATDGVAVGVASKFMRFVTKWGGHNGWVNRIRVNSMTADAHHYWQMRDTKFEDMASGEQAALQKFGIDGSAWDTLRKIEATDIKDGQKGFLPSDISKTDLAQFGEGTEVQLTRARDELAAKYRNLLGESADRATVSPSLANQAHVGLGYSGVQANTAAGFLYRSALQLKGFVINYLYGHMARELYGYSSEYRSFPQAMSDLFTGKNPNAAKGLSKLMVAGAINFYAVNALKDLAIGKTPLDVTDWDVKKHGSLWDTPGFTAAMKAWGKQSFGLYGDILMGDAGGPPKSWMETIPEKFIGPEAEFAGNIADSATSYMRAMGKNGGPGTKELDGASQKLFGTLYRQAPGTQLFFTKAVGDTYLYNAVAEAMNPGFQKRADDRLKKTGQTVWLPK